MSDRLHFVGDVHGWLDRLEDLLPRIDGDLLFLGDLIDRGPESAGVVARVRGLCDAGRARCLLGNHEFALIRGLGVPERGIAPYPELLIAWHERYGGDETARSYGVEAFDPPALRAALGDDLEWLVDLPWCARGTVGGRRYLAVHGGLGPEPLACQLCEFVYQRRWQRTHRQLPPALYSKNRRRTRPCDLDPDVCLISGHTPLERPYLTPGRILCDTTGGRLGRELTAIALPDGTMASSRLYAGVENGR